MRFAVPTFNGKMCAHFGHCQAFALVDVDEKGEIRSETYFDAPPHTPGLLPKVLKEKGVDVVIAQGMGVRAQEFFREMGIKVVTGAIGEDPVQVVKEYIAGLLKIGENVCDH